MLARNGSGLEDSPSIRHVLARALFQAVVGMSCALGRTSTGFVPSGRRYELRPWIAPLCTLCDEDIAPAQCAAKVFEDAAGERAALHLTGFDEYRRFPGRRH